MSLVLAAIAVAAAAPACKPEKPEMKKYRVGEQGLAEEREMRNLKLRDLPLAKLGGVTVSAAEIVEFLKDLPPFQRYYYSAPLKAELLVQNYLVLQVLAREASDQGFDADPYTRFVLEEALAARYRHAVRAAAVKPSDIAGADVKLLEEKREAAWQARLDELRRGYGISRNEK